MNIKTKINEKSEIFLYLIAYVLILLVLSTSMTSCSDSCEIEQTYTYYEPVYTSMDEIRSSVKVSAPHEISVLGKIYFKDNFLFINEPNEGIHVINNQDPSNPVNTAFIEVPGSFDLSIRGNILFSDSYMDLVAIDISNLNAVTEVGRYEGIFSQYNSYGFYATEEFGVVTDWTETTELTVTETSCEGQMYTWGRYYEAGIALNDASAFNATSAVAPTNPGIAGSMSRFTIANDNLYAIDAHEIVPVDISNAQNLNQGTRLQLDWGLETVFPLKNNVFVGSIDGMYILDVTNALNPELISKYQHIRSCDPVVVQDDLAYVTLRSGTQCQGFTDQLEVIDISDLSEPKLLHVYPMYNPHGLGIDDEALFICDGDAGLKVFDASDISNIDNNMTAHYQDLFAYDIIPFNNVAMMIAEDGLYQYDYSDVQNISLLSKINITNED